MVKPDKLNQFHLCLYKDVYPIKDSQIEEIEDFLKDTKFHILASDITSKLPDIENQWETQYINHNYTLNGDIQTKAYKLNFNKGKNIANQILNGQLTEKTFNAVVCYYLYNFFTLIDIKIKSKENLNEINSFFEVFQKQDEKSQIIIPALINRILKKSNVASQWGLKIKIDNNWTCTFLNENDKGLKSTPDSKHSFIKNEKAIDDFEITKPVLKVSEDPQQSYFDSIKIEFSEIRLLSVGFKLPIENFVELPILKSDKRLTQEQAKLKNRLTSFKSVIKSEEKKIKIKNRLDEIKKILDAKHSIIDVIELRKDIFIKSSAGSGKSSSLKWLTYTIASKKKYHKIFFPIFIELKYYTEEVLGLEDLINDKLGDYNINTDIFEGKTLLLFLDGYDEYNQDKTRLLKKIISFRKKYQNCQLIFTGRYEPNFSRHDIEFVIYKLNEFDKANIKTLFKGYWGEEIGLSYANFFENKGILSSLTKPLYTAFVMAYIKSKEKKSVLNLDDISSTLLNKGKLLSELVINKFLKEYEQKKSEDQPELWKVQKDKELDILIQLAFYMTMIIGDSEVIKWSNAITFIKSKIDLNTTSNGLQAESLLNNMLNHNILNLYNGFLSFDKKELRLFFTAKYLSSKIDSRATFLSFKDNLFSKVKNDSTWNSIETYLLGIIDSNILVDLFILKKYHGEYLLSKKFFEQIDFLLQTGKQKNFPSDYYADESELFELVYDVSKKLNIISQLPKKNTYIISLIVLFRKLIYKYPKLDVLLSKSIIKKNNYRYLQYMNWISYKNLNTVWFSNVFLNYDFRLTFDKLQYILPKIYIVDRFNRGEYFYLIFSGNSKIVFSDKNVLDLCFQYVCNRKGNHLYGHYFNRNAYVFEKFLEKRIHPIIDKFLLYFYSKNPTPNYVSYYRLLKNFKRIGWSFSIKKFKNFPNDIQEKLSSTVFYGLLKFKPEDKYYHQRYLLDIIESIEDKLLRTNLSFRAMEALKYHDNLNESNRMKCYTVIMSIGSTKQANELKKEEHKILNIEGLLFMFKSLYHDSKANRSIKVVNQFEHAIDSKWLDTHSLSKLLESIKGTSPSLNKKIAAMALENKDPVLLFSYLLFFQRFKVIESIPFLLQEINGQEDLWCYHILYLINIKYYFDYHEHFSAKRSLALKLLEDYENGLKWKIDRGNIFEFLYIVDKDIFSIIKRVSNDELHKKTFREINSFYQLLERMEHKVNNIEKYQLIHK